MKVENLKEVEEEEEKVEEIKENTAMKIVGWIITLAGFGFLFIKAFGSMTGFVISESKIFTSNYIYLIGLIKIIIGSVLIMLSKRKSLK